jgi:hypothetical protein
MVPAEQAVPANATVQLGGRVVDWDRIRDRR